MNTNTTSNMMQIVAVIERGEGDNKKAFWQRIGVAFENRDAPGTCASTTSPPARRPRSAPVRPEGGAGRGVRRRWHTSRSPLRGRSPNRRPALKARPSGVCPHRSHCPAPLGSSDKERRPFRNRTMRSHPTVAGIVRM